jgi:hypothetical protein
MQYLNPTFSIAPPAAVTCCEACVYGRGAHAAFCEGSWLDEALLALVRCKSRPYVESRDIPAP